jgi:glycogen debranching enzyme
VAARNRARADAGLAALERLWSEAQGLYLPMDRIGQRLCDSPSIGGVIPVFAPIPRHHARAIAATLSTWGAEVRYLVPSHSPIDRNFDLRRYWRGPVWLVCNYLVAEGLTRAGETAMAGRVLADSLDLIRDSGFAEYYDPRDGTPLGGGRFSWTAAMVLEFLAWKN